MLLDVEVAAPPKLAKNTRRAVGFADRNSRPMSLEHLTGGVVLGQSTALAWYRDFHEDDFDNYWGAAFGNRSATWESELLPERAVVPLPAFRGHRLLGHVALSVWLTKDGRINEFILGNVEWQLREHIAKLWDMPLPPEPIKPTPELIDISRQNYWSGEQPAPIYSHQPATTVAMELWQTEYTRWLFHCLVDALRNNAPDAMVAEFFRGFPNVGFDNVPEPPEFERLYAPLPRKQNLWTEGLTGVRESEAWDIVRSDEVHINTARNQMALYEPVPEADEEEPYPW